MKKIRNLKDAVRSLDIDVEGIDVVKDVLLQAFTFESCFDKNSTNEVVILEKDEEYSEPELIPEIVENIGDYEKKLYIVCDSGEGLVVYRQKGGTHE